MSILERATRTLAQQPGTLVFPEGEDERVVSAAARLRQSLPSRVLLLGRPEAVAELARRAGVPLAGIEIRDPADGAAASDLIEGYLAQRPGAGGGVAARLVRRPLHHAGMLLRLGIADAMVAGATCPTGRVIEAALMTVGLAPGVTTPSSCFLMNVPHAAEPGPRTLLFADCAVNVDPGAEALADIGVASAACYRELTGEEPRVAFLSFATRGSARHPAVERVRAAVAIARQRLPQLLVDGELQADAALSERVAALKVRDASAVAGRANVLVFPNLDAANIGYKLVQYLGGAQALGPFLQGFARPVSDLSRGASVDDIVSTAIVTLARAATQPARSDSGT
ncbi:MAG: phosphate acetyltransferase [Gammaproteobacteria bacterium]|nr:phosphate acetyltransferase [Gammaproteobacteria bacterium]